jgi:uncharacterized protein
MIVATARTFPMTDLYDVATELTSLGTGEALVTVISPRGVPTPTVHCVMRPPRSRMAQLDPAAFGAVVAESRLVAEYLTDVDPQSAREMLTARMAEAQATAAQAQTAKSQADVWAEIQAKARAEGQVQARSRPRAASPARSSSGGSGGFDLEEAAKLGTRVLTSSTTNTLLRGLFGTLTGTPARRRRRR